MSGCFSLAFAGDGKKKRNLKLQNSGGDNDKKEAITSFTEEGAQTVGGKQSPPKEVTIAPLANTFR